MRRNLEHQQRSTSGIVDLWEHACLLYHSYEWQSAADTFHQLEQQTSDLEDKCVFAMNKGLIEARLGDLDAAMISFIKALEYSEDNPVAHFLLGLAHTVPRNYAKAKTQFEHCLKCLNAKEHDYRNSFNLDALIVQENIDHMRSKLIATAAGHGRTSHLRTRLHIIPAEVLFEPPSRSNRASQRDSKSSTEHKLDSIGSKYADGRLQGPISRATQPLHVAGHDVQSLHLVEDAEKNLAIASRSDTVNDVRKHRRLTPRDPRVQHGSMQELAQFLRHAGPSGDANVTVDREYMQRLLQGNRHDRTSHQSHSQVSEPRDELESLLGLYTGTSSIGRRSVPTTINSSVSDALTVRQDNDSEHTVTVAYERPLTGRENPSGPRRPTLESAYVLQGTSRSIQLWI
jgi:tetratricopeptide (TPR) repeat protein